MVADRTNTLTDEQRAAIAQRAVSVALSAGAGCGKTFVLTERFLSHLDPHGPPQRRVAGLGQIVAITFTERAAREMRDRIRDACRNRLLAAPDDQDAGHWLGLLRELDSARIGTIHGFCASLLRSHAVEAAIDPRFAVLEAAQSSTLLVEAMDDEFRRSLAARDEATLDLVARLGLGRLREYLAHLVERRQEIDFDRWRDETAAGLVERWFAFHGHTAVPALLERLHGAAETRELVEVLHEHVPDHPVMQMRRAALLELLPRLLQNVSNPDALLEEIRENAKVQSGGGARVWPTEAVYNLVKTRMTRVREEVVRIARLAELDREACLAAAALGLQLFEVAERVVAAYQRRKRDAAQLDFNDLLIASRDLLAAPANEAVRRAAAASIDMLLVDEFQDTDPLQVELIELLCGVDLHRGKLFFVGDHKQSIYRFRGADPRVFRDLRHRVPDAGRLPLSLNFRSQPAILEFVNAVFSDAWGDAYEPLRAHRRQTTPVPAIEFLWAPADDEKVPKTDQRRREADWIARRLRALVDSAEPLVPEKSKEADIQETLRPVRPGDIAILFRALSDVEHYEAALRRYGLDYYLVGGHAFYAQQEIYDLLNLLRSLVSSCDEVSLAGVLRSPFFSLTDEALFWLAQHPRGLMAGLFDAGVPQQLDAGQRNRVAFAAQTLAHLRAIKDRRPIAELVNEALARTGYDAALLAEFLGERKLANLRKLVEQARQFDRAGTFTLDDFIAQLAEFVARQPHEPPAATQPEDTDVVRLMTIHQAKGLEFPVVVVPDLDRKGNPRSAGVAFSPVLGPLVRVPQEGDDKQPTTGYELLAFVEQEEEEAESRRLFYVAATRAADYLILSSSVKTVGEPAGGWMQLLARRFDLETGAWRGRLPSDLPVPSIRVTTSEPPLADKQRTARDRVDLEKRLAEVQQAVNRGKADPPRLVAAVPVRMIGPTQFSVSRLSGQVRITPVEADEAGEPYATTEWQLDAAASDARQFGTLVHAVLAELPWSWQVETAAAVRRVAENLDLGDCVELKTAVELVEQFRRSPRAQELQRTAEVHTELEFLLAWPADVPGAPPGSYVRGFIDCLYRDERGAWRLLDYKTNRVTDSTIDQIAQEYELQMAVYALAAEQSLGVELAACTLHFLRTGDERTFAVGAAAGRRAESLLAAAAASMLSD